MGFQVGGVGHSSFRWSGLGGEGSENAVKDAAPASVNEAVIPGLVWILGDWHIAPLRAVADDADGATRLAPVIHPWGAVREQGMHQEASHPPSGQQERRNGDGSISTTP